MRGIKRDGVEPDRQGQRIDAPPICNNPSAMHICKVPWQWTWGGWTWVSWRSRAGIEPWGKGGRPMPVGGCGRLGAATPRRLHVSKTHGSHLSGPTHPLGRSWSSMGARSATMVGARKESAVASPSGRRDTAQKMDVTLRGWVRRLTVWTRVTIVNDRQ
jgi:hypothetical protein